VRCAPARRGEIAREFTARTGHYVRRVSLGYRNRADVPGDYERQKLEEFDRLNREKKLANDYFEVVKEGQVSPLPETAHRRADGG